MDPYDTLGVGKNATPDEIKRARRKKAKQLHPDRNHGDNAKMAEVNLAHDILIDPVRRANFEQQGHTRVTTEEEEARKMVVQGFLEMMNSRQRINVPKRMEKALKDTLAKCPIQRSHLQTERAYYAGRRDELASTDPLNLWAGIIDQQVRGCDDKLAQLAREEGIVKRALEIVQLYRSGVVEAIEPGGIRFGSGVPGREDLADALRGMFGGASSAPGARPRRP